MMQLGYSIINVYALGLIAYTLCSWVKHNKVKAVEKWLSPLYDWALRPIRRVVKPLINAIHVDITPMILLLGIIIVRKIWILLWFKPY